MSPRAHLDRAGTLLTVTWPDGADRRLAVRWLYDHATDARDAVSGQRRHGGAELAEAGPATDAEIAGDRLTVRFASGATRAIGLSSLEGGPDKPPVRLWETPDVIIQAPPIEFRDYLARDAALEEVLIRVVKRGLAVLSGAGEDPDVVESAVARFGFVRETNYGRLFDVRIEPQPGNLAYTDRALDLHTDNPYRDPVPTLQLLHALRNDEGGGETLFVDGFAHAQALRDADPGAFDLLASTPVRFTFGAADGARWSFEAPVVRLDPRGDLEALRVNHRSLDLEPGDAAAVDAWYDAYLALYRRLHAPEAAFERRLAPGDLVIFDNRRLVHGRRSLAATSPRWLRGCYADMDGVTATLARLRSKSHGG